MGYFHYVHRWEQKRRDIQAVARDQLNTTQLFWGGRARPLQTTKLFFVSVFVCKLSQHASFFMSVKWAYAAKDAKLLPQHSQVWPA